MDWSFDKSKAWTREIWPFKAPRALGIAAVANALRELNGFPKQKCVLEVS